MKAHRSENGVPFFRSRTIPGFAGCVTGTHDLVRTGESPPKPMAPRQAQQIYHNAARSEPMPKTKAEPKPEPKHRSSNPPRREDLLMNFAISNPCPQKSHDKNLRFKPQNHFRHNF